MLSSSGHRGARLGEFTVKGVPPGSSRVRVNVSHDVHGTVSVASAQLVQEVPEEPEEKPEAKAEEKAPEEKSEEKDAKAEEKAPEEAKPFEEAAPKKKRKSVSRKARDFGAFWCSKRLPGRWMV